MRILVFGSNGQLGQELQAIGKRLEFEIVPVSHRDTDIGDRAAVHRALVGVQPDVVVNAAAYTKVDQAEIDSEVAWSANCQGPTNLAEACSEHARPLVHISTDYVFSGTKAEPYNEADPVDPLGVYGATKEAGERAVRQLASKHIILRTAWVIGPYGANFLKTMVRLAQERDELSVVADQVGNPTTTSDLAKAALIAAQRAVELGDCWGTFHFAGNGDASWYELASEVVSAQATLTGKRPRVKPISTVEYPTRAHRPPNSRLDSSLFARTFGFRASPWRGQIAPIVAEVLRGVSSAP